MNRRNAVKNLVLASGGLITLPMWMQSCGISDTNTHQSSFSADEQVILAKVTDTIIPDGNAIGALSVGVDKFLQKLIDDCYEKPVQDNVKKQLQALNAAAKTTYKKSFVDCTQQQRQEALMKFSTSQNKDEKDFFDLIKSETIRGFNTSQKVMQDYLNYQIAPGHYYGCVNVKA
jgi:acyl CoA:acetate/3-ketoacid CoA transferase